jgi:hypothetical protein
MHVNCPLRTATPISLSHNLRVFVEQINQLRGAHRDEVRHNLSEEAELCLVPASLACNVRPRTREQTDGGITHLA